jgi:hypothetical protein
MNSSQYPAENRKQLKRDQRTHAYRELQQRSAEARALLERALASRNEAIDRLKKRLSAVGVADDEIAKLAKLAA